MKTNYFELYESRRKKYKPGTVWGGVGRGVKKFEVIASSRLKYSSEYTRYRGSDEPDSSCENLIYLRVLESTSGLVGFHEGGIVAWSKAYTEKYYVPLLS
jgi:hypothetical protein